MTIDVNPIKFVKQPMTDLCSVAVFSRTIIAFFLSFHFLLNFLLCQIPWQIEMLSCLSNSLHNNDAFMKASITLVTSLKIPFINVEAVGSNPVPPMYTSLYTRERRDKHKLITRTFLINDQC